MRASSTSFHGPCLRQQGVAAVEFALVCAVFLMLLIGMMEMGRMLFYWNSAAEATRFGARMAVVCGQEDQDLVRTRMRERLSILPPGNISINYEPAGCTVDTCQSVTVSILAGVSIATFIPYVPLSLSLPPFSTNLPREGMQSAVGGVENPVCR